MNIQAKEKFQLTLTQCSFCF